MYASEVKIAVNHGLPLLVILLSDGHLGTIRASATRQRLSISSTVISSPSWCKAFEGMGVEAILIENEKDLYHAIRGWNMKKPLFIEIHFDPEAYGEMTCGIR